MRGEISILLCCVCKKITEAINLERERLTITSPLGRRIEAPVCKGILSSFDSADSDSGAWERSGWGFGDSGAGKRSCC